MGSFAEKLKELREQAGLTQYALAAKSGLSRQILSKLELGQHEPSWMTVQILSTALGVDCIAFADEIQLPEPGVSRGRGRPRKPVEDAAGKAPGSPVDATPPKAGRKSTRKAGSEPATKGKGRKKKEG